MVALRFSEFRDQHSSQGADEFLGAVTVPHLLFSAASPNLSTKSLGVLTREVDRGKLREGLLDVRMFPVRKQPGSVFSLMITLGRAQNCDVVLDHRGVSKFHAYMRQVGAQWFLSDANSSNGTRVEGLRLPPERSHVLKPGCEITLGEAVTLQYLEPQGLLEMLTSLSA
jgi:hypothetical protein